MAVTIEHHRDNAAAPLIVNPSLYDWAKMARSIEVYGVTSAIIGFNHFA